MKIKPEDKEQVEKIIETAQDLMGGESGDLSQMTDQFGGSALRQPRGARTPRDLQDIDKVADWLSAGNTTPFKSAGNSVPSSAASKGLPLDKLGGALPFKV